MVRSGALVVALWAFLALGVTQMAVSEEPSSCLVEGASATPAIPRFTPLVGHVLQPPQAAEGSDGKIHLVYEIFVANAGNKPVKVDALVIKSGEGKTLKEYKGDVVSTRIGLLGTRAPTDTFQPGQAGMIWVHLALPLDQKVPAKLVHEFTLAMGDRSLSEETAPVEVNLHKPIVIGPPLKGTNWLSADGCCEATRHVRAALSVNGAIHSAQRYAIDWEQVDDQNRIRVGDAKDVTSFICYGKEIIAVADAKVVEAVDQFKDQVPGGLPSNIGIEEVDGNHVVLDLGGGHYCLYAHMKPGSVRVKPGDTVTRGQVLGLVGNTGNSSAPHLHFHVMNGPSPLASEGVPYLLDRFAVTGHWKTTEEFDEAEATGKPLAIQPVDPPSEQGNQLPLDFTRYDFLNGSP